MHGGWIDNDSLDALQCSCWHRWVRSERFSGADISQLLEIIRNASCIADPKRLMLVGHNPGMHELAITLAGSGDAAGRAALGGNLPTAGLAVFDFGIDDWSDVGLRRGRLELFISPKLLKQTSGD